MDSKPSISKSELSDTIDNFIKEEQKEVQFVSVYEQIIREKGCRYKEGPVTQEVYGCATCNVEGGICAFCSLDCHKDHQIFEIGLRGSFQCDCPTKKFPGECSSFKNQEKKEENAGNIYNQNFKALFCSCHKKILTEEEDMMQCALCADYFHPTCQQIPLPLKEEIFNPEKEQPFSFTCNDCFNNKVAFLKLYPETLLTAPEDFAETYDSFRKDEVVDREKLIDCYIRKMSILKGFKPVKQQDIENNEEEISDQDNSELGKRAPADRDEPEDDCDLLDRKKILNQAAIDMKTTAGVFLKEDMFDALCKCEDCIKLYDKSDPLSGLLTDKVYQDANYEEAVAKTDSLPLPEPEKKTENPDIQFIGYMENKFKERTGRNISPHEKLIMSEHYSRLKQRLGDMILGCGKTEITEEDMRNFLSNLKTD